ncbi:hypothetical protein KY312_02980 [Candidatus Woesearchaeota archaeon]|nr:hypothetical protein [Candidatus Woesearchaeota archaeon]
MKKLILILSLILLFVPAVYAIPTCPGNTPEECANHQDGGGDAVCWNCQFGSCQSRSGQSCNEHYDCAPGTCNSEEVCVAGIPQPGPCPSRVKNHQCMKCEDETYCVPDSSKNGNTLCDDCGVLKDSVCHKNLCNNGGCGVVLQTMVGESCDESCATCHADGSCKGPEWNVCEAGKTGTSAGCQPGEKCDPYSTVTRKTCSGPDKDVKECECVKSSAYLPGCTATSTELAWTDSNGNTGSVPIDLTGVTTMTGFFDGDICAVNDQNGNTIATSGALGGIGLTGPLLTVASLATGSLSPGSFSGEFEGNPFSMNPGEIKQFEGLGTLTLDISTLQITGSDMLFDFGLLETGPSTPEFNNIAGVIAIIVVVAAAFLLLKKKK